MNENFKKECLSVNEAYFAMFCFLENLYDLTKSDDLGGFLGGMQLDENGIPFDSAVTEDWLKSVKKSIEHFRSH